MVIIQIVHAILIVMIAYSYPAVFIKTLYFDRTDNLFGLFKVINSILIEIKSFNLYYAVFYGPKL